MAIVKSIVSGTAVVNIDDSCFRGISTEELTRRREQIDRQIWNINRNHQQRMVEDKEGASHEIREIPQAGRLG